MILAAFTGVSAGILFPDTVTQSAMFSVLAAFVAINTVMYSALAVAKMLPKVHPGSWLGGGRGRRTQSRSIYPMSDDHPRSAD